MRVQSGSAALFAAVPLAVVAGMAALVRAAAATAAQRRSARGPRRCRVQRWWSSAGPGGGGPAARPVEIQAITFMSGSLAGQRRVTYAAAGHARRSRWETQISRDSHRPLAERLDCTVPCTKNSGPCCITATNRGCICRGPGAIFITLRAFRPDRKFSKLAKSLSRENWRLVRPRRPDERERCRAGGER